MHGNLTEWCRDQFLPYRTPARPGDGLRVESPDDPIASDRVTARGGSFYVPAAFAASRARHQYPRSHKGMNLGIRPIIAGWPPSK